MTRSTNIGTSGGAADPDDWLLTEVLRPYRANCRYLKDCGMAEVSDGSGALVSATGKFEIPESCYIDDTGHFNSVEFNICYNQLSYYLLAKSLQGRLLKPLAHWTLADYWPSQLSNFLITDFRSHFGRAMSARSFSGEVRFLDFSERTSTRLGVPLIVLRSACSFRDESGGHCGGEVTFAVIDSKKAQSS